MNDEVEQQLGSQPPLESPGARLRTARESQGLTRESVAASLRLRTDIVEALEQDQFDQLPEPIFVRGYLRSYSGLLELPADELVSAYDELIGAQHAPKLVAEQARKQVRSGDRAVRYASYMIGLLLLILVVAWWNSEQGPRFWQRDGIVPESAESGESATAQPEQAAVPETEPTPQPRPEATPAPQPQATPVPEDTQDTGEAAPAVTEPPAPQPQAVPPEPETPAVAAPEIDMPESSEPSGAETEAESAAAATQEPAAEQPPSAGEAQPAEPAAGPDAGAQTVELTLHFRDDSWVEVHDSTGERLMYRLGQSGESRSARGEPPFSILLGNARAVDVEVDGEPYDHSRHIEGNVARFEVGG